MTRFHVALVSAVFLTTFTLIAEGQGPQQPPAAGHAFVFRDAGDEAGLFPHVGGIRGHGVAWGDGDGRLDLVTCERYYGAVKYGPALFRNLGNYLFENVARDAGLPAGLSGLGVAVADVNNDGWPDVFLTSGDGEHRLYLNDGKGKF